MSHFVLSPDVQQALDAGHPMVALESALMTHGFAYPDSIDIVQRMIEVIQSEDVMPVLIGVWRGCPTVGLSLTQAAELAADQDAVKVSVRDLPLCALRGAHGGTTVAATALLAHRAGIRAFATGGIGGVHRGHPEDVSADLPVLASTPVIVVCAGAKSVLDLPRTLEYLETWGVPVLGWQTQVFPAFYSRTSDLAVDQCVETPAHVAEVYAAQRALCLPQGLLVTVPIPVEDEMPVAEIEPLIARAVAEADAQGIKGKAITPFILSRLVALSDARSKRANESLLVHNAHVAAQIAAALP